ncbi:MAG: efflux RND transporter periplasmic adaptor subunit [Gammaproteobacteria bacterium]|nr:efflux RND transporter periplasmic adaptor subunit [Gammaproteobacteria bacterium]
MTARLAIVLAAVTALAACTETEPASEASIYETAPVETRPIEVTVDAAGVIEPETLVEVKSKASGEILAIHAETGDVVEAGFLLVEVDQRTPRNQLAEAEAALVAARARRGIAQTQMERAETLYGTGTLTQTDFEQSQLEFANAEADVIGKEVALENARIAMDDTEVRAPITGTIIERRVEPGTVISSPTRDVAGGSVILRMADLSSVQVRTLVDEIDIGKIRPGMTTRVTVAAYPNQPFDGTVLKIEPQAILEQNVTRFAVLIRLQNRGDLLKPGMNAEVEIQIASRESVPTIPTMALRVPDDITATAAMLGLPEEDLRGQLGDLGAVAGGASRSPAGQEQIRALFMKQRNGEALTADEQALLAQARSRRQGTGGGMGGGPGISRATAAYEFGGDFWVIAMRGGEPTPLAVRTGLTDLQYSEIVAGLSPGDEVLLLPSTSLFEQQAFLQERIQQRYGSGSPFQQPTGGGRRYR